MGKEHPLFPADAAADFHNDVFIVVGVLWQQQKQKLPAKRFQTRPGLVVFFFRKLFHLRVFHHDEGGISVGLRSDALPVF